MLVSERPLVRDSDGRVTGRRRLRHVSKTKSGLEATAQLTLVLRGSLEVPRGLGELPMALEALLPRADRERSQARHLVFPQASAREE